MLSKMGDQEEAGIPQLIGGQSGGIGKSRDVRLKNQVPQKSTGIGVQLALGDGHVVRTQSDQTARKSQILPDV